MDLRIYASTGAFNGRSTYRNAHKDNVLEDDDEIETEDRLVPISWVLWGSGGAIVIGTLLVWLVFGSQGIKPWATVIGFLF